MRWLLLLFVLLVADLALLVGSFGQLGLWPTLGLLALGAVAGVVFARSEGLRVFRSYLDAVRSGQLPEEGILSGFLVLAGGALLLFPGFLSDLAGLVLLIPFSRRLVADRLRRRLFAGATPLHVVQFGPPARGSGDQAAYWDETAPESGEVIDTEGVVVESQRLLPAAPAGQSDAPEARGERDSDGSGRTGA